MERCEPRVWAEGEQKRHIVCEEEVEVIRVAPTEGPARILGPVVGTTTKPLGEQAKLNKRCLFCDNKSPKFVEDGHM